MMCTMKTHKNLSFIWVFGWKSTKIWAQWALNENLQKFELNFTHDKAYKNLTSIWDLLKETHTHLILNWDLEQKPTRIWPQFKTSGEMLQNFELNFSSQVNTYKSLSLISIFKQKPTKLELNRVHDEDLQKFDINLSLWAKPTRNWIQWCPQWKSTKTWAQFESSSETHKKLISMGSTTKTHKNLSSISPIMKIHINLNLIWDLWKKPTKFWAQIQIFSKNLWAKKPILYWFLLWTPLSSNFCRISSKASNWGQIFVGFFSGYEFELKFLWAFFIGLKLMSNFVDFHREWNWIQIFVGFHYGPH